MNPPFRNKNLLVLSGEIGYFAISIAGILSVDDPQNIPIVCILIVLIGIIFLPNWNKNLTPWFVHLRTAVLTILITWLVVLQPGWGVFPILFFLLSPEVMIHYPQRIGLIWLGVFTLLTGGVFVFTDGLVGLIQLLPYASGYFFFGLFGWVMMQAERDRQRSEQLLTELQETHRQLQEYAERLEELTIAQERNRIAREMHDTLGHRLTIASVQLEGAQRLIYTNPHKVDQILGTVREQVRDGLADLRRTVAMLRASVEEDLPLPQALTKLANQVHEATGIEIHLILEDAFPTLPPSHRQAIYRAAQECLTNIQRHARASEAWIHVRRQDGKISVLIEDNGEGIQAGQMKNGFGLSGLRERSALLGGDCFVDPRPGGGTQITFRLPLPEDSKNG